MVVVVERKAQLPLAEPPKPTPLFVLIICQACFRQVQVLCEEGFDIAAVRHDCDEDKAFTVSRA